MAVYGSRAGVEQLLRATVTAVFNDDQTTRIDNLLAVFSALIEQETGRTFGTGATTETVIIANSVWFPLTPTWGWSWGGYQDRLGLGVSPILVLPKGVRTITSVTVGGVWDGVDYEGGEPMDIDQYQPIFQERTGEYLALRTLDGSYWPYPVAITGTWEDTDADTDVPPEITYLANALAAERWKQEMASPNGMVGPDGNVLPLRNMFKDPTVQKILEKWTATREELLI